MIKINLLAERKPAKTKAAPAVLKFEGSAGNQNLLLAAILIIGALVAGGWWWVRASERDRWKERRAANEVELQRLAEIRAKAEAFKVQKDLLEKKITLITELKKKQSVPVHILDQISRNVPDFLWLDSMSASSNQINIVGKATTYNAVSNFYDNLLASGQFADVVMGKAAEVPEGVSFSLACRYVAPTEPGAKSEGGVTAPQPPRG